MAVASVLIELDVKVTPNRLVYILGGASLYNDYGWATNLFLILPQILSLYHVPYVQISLEIKFRNISIFNATKFELVYSNGLISGSHFSFPFIPHSSLLNF